MVEVARDIICEELSRLRTRCSLPQKQSSSTTFHPRPSRPLKSHFQLFVEVTNLKLRLNLTFIMASGYDRALSGMLSSMFYSSFDLQLITSSLQVRLQRRSSFSRYLTVSSVPMDTFSKSNTLSKPSNEVHHPFSRPPTQAKSKQEPVQ